MNAFSKCALAGAFGLFLLGAPPALAHPHVWVTYTMKVTGGKDGIQKIRFVWRFDAMFTQMVKEEFDLKTITTKDSALIEKKAFANLKNYNYYTHIIADGQEFRPQAVEDFSAEMKGENLQYTFTIALPKPAKKMELSIWDEEFYVDLDPPTMEKSSDKTPGFMSVKNFVVKPFVSVDSVGGAPAPSCNPRTQERENVTWGKFTTFVVECKASP